MAERVNEHTWHACTTPPPAEAGAAWSCPVCRQVWIWTRPPRPAARWTRRDR